MIRDTLEDLSQISVAKLPNGAVCFVKEVQSDYVYSRENEEGLEASGPGSWVFAVGSAGSNSFVPGGVFYEDAPSGAQAELFVLPISESGTRISKLSFAAALPADPGHSVSLSLYRYRNTAGFFYSQISDVFVYDDTQPFSTEIDISSTLRNASFQANDLVAVSYVTVGASVRAAATRWKLSSAGATGPQTGGSPSAETPGVWPPVIIS